MKRFCWVAVLIAALSFVGCAGFRPVLSVQFEKELAAITTDIDRLKAENRLMTAMEQAEDSGAAFWNYDAATPVLSDEIGFADDPGGSPSFKNCTFETAFDLFVANNWTMSGDFTFTGDVALPDDVVDMADLNATGTADDTTYLRGDGTWQTVSGITDELIKVSSNDTTAGYLNGKLVAGESIDLTEGSDGGDETLTVSCEDASTTNKGVVETATTAEVNAGASTAVAITPDALAGSVLGTKTLSIDLFDYSIPVTTGNGKRYFVIPEEMNGMNLVSIGLHCFTTSSSGNPTVMVHNLTDTVDMLSTGVSIDATEYDSKDAATGATIDTDHDDVATGDVLRFDVDTAGTGTCGLQLRLGFRLP